MTSSGYLDLNTVSVDLVRILSGSHLLRPTAESMDQTIISANVPIETKQVDQDSTPMSKAIASQSGKSDERLKAWLDLLDSWNINDEMVKLNDSLSDGFLCLARDKYHNSWKYVSLRDIWWNKTAKSDQVTGSRNRLSAVNPAAWEQDSSSPGLIVELKPRWKIVFVDDDEHHPGKQKMQLIDTSNHVDGSPVIPGFGVLHSDMVRRAQKGFEDATKQAVVLATYAFNLDLDRAELG